MKCLNTSLPLVQQTLSVLKSEPLAAKVISMSGENPGMDDIMRSYYQLTSGMTAKANEELDNYLLNFLKAFGVKSKEFESLKDRLGIDALGATDVLNKLIWYRKDRNMDTIPEEAAHMIVMLMGETNPDIKSLLTEIKLWDGYKEVYDKYMPIYKNEKQVKIEAIGKLISQALVKNFNESGLDRSLLERVMRVIKDFFNRLDAFMASPSEAYFTSRYLADKIAVNVLSGNTNYIANLKNTREQLDYQKALNSNPHAKTIIDRFTKGRFNFKLVGSLAIAGQGENIYRPSSEPIHDLDFIVESLEEYNDLVNYLDQINAMPVHDGWKHTDYTTYAYFIPADGYEIRVLSRKTGGWADKVEVYDKKAGKVVPMTSQNVIATDFFVYYTKPNETNVGIFKSWQDIYVGKLLLSPLQNDERMFQRSKDQQDYVLSKPSNLSVSKSEFVYYQLEEDNKQLEQKVKNFLASIGVRLSIVDQLRDREGKPMTGAAMADMLNKVINVVEGRADVGTLPEEAAHFFVEMLGTGSPLYKEMYDKVTSYKLYSDVVAAYKDNRLYRNNDGTINFEKLKKEAMGKMIMKYIIQDTADIDTPAKVQEVRNWWQKVWEFIKNIFSKAPKRGVEIENPFAESARRILENDIEELSEENIGSDEYLQAAAPQNDFAGKLFEKVKELQKTLVPDDTIDPVTKKPRHGYKIDGKPILNKDGTPRSVTENVVKPWYKAKFPIDKRSDIDKAVDEIKAEYGTEIHGLIENIIKRYVDPQTGLLRTVPLASPTTKFNVNVQSKLDSYINQLVRSYPAGTRFLAEARVYNRRKNLPGTVDLLVFLQDGSMDVYDWKTQEIRDGETELKWFKEPAYRLQLGEYTEALEKEYGILKFNKVRAIPIRTIFKGSKVQGTWVPNDLNNIEIGPVNPAMLPDGKDYLMPVVAKNESTDDEMLDDLIVKLNNIYEKLSKVSTKNKDKKNIELNKIAKTIRQLQVKRDMKEFVQSGLIEIDKYNDKLINGTFTEGEVMQAIEIMNVYATGSQYLKSLLVKLKTQIEQTEDPEVKHELEKQQQNYTKMALNAQDLVLSLKKKGKQLIDQKAQSEGIKGILDPERVMDYLQRSFRSLSTLDTAAAQLLNRYLNRARHQRDIEVDDNYEKLRETQDKLKAWASKKGISTDKMFEGILDGSNFLNIYSKEWFEKRDAAIRKGDAEWIKKNTVFDEEAYKAAFQKYRDTVLSDTYDIDPEKDKEKKERMIIRWIEMHNGGQSKIAQLMKKGNYLKPKETWYSEKYKNLLKPENKPLKDAYDLFQSMLRDSEKAGMIDYDFGFIPSMHRTKLEAFVFGDYANLLKRENFLQDLAVDSSNQFGKIDPLTGKPILEIPVYFTRELGENKSLDLFKVFATWSAQTANYKAMSSIEDTANLLLMVEQTKGSLQTNQFSKVKNGVKLESNTINAEVLENHIKYQIYGQKVNMDNDKVVKMGDKEVSLTRGLQKVLYYFGLKTLALNPISGTAAFVGGTLNASFLASKNLYFNDRDWAMGIKDTTARDAEFYAFMDYISPELQDEKYRKARQLSVSEAVKRVNAEDFYTIQRFSDKGALYPVVAAMYRSHMVDDNGKIVYIPDYVKAKYGYENMYNLPAADRKAIQNKIDAEVKQLKDTRSLRAKSKIVNGKLEIEGLKKADDQIMLFRNKIKKVNKTIIGNATQEDINEFRMTMTGQVLMQFRSWIPQMVAERFGDMAYDLELETYSTGKARIFFKNFVNKKMLPLIGELIVGYGNNTIERAKERYREYVIRRKEAGDFNFEDRMSEAQFIDMYLANMRSMKRELLVILAFLALIFWLKGGDDKRKKTPTEKIMARAVSKYFNELAFFYNPIEAKVLLKSPVPVIGLFEDMWNFFSHSFGQLGGLAMSNEEVMKKNKPLKYFNKMFPGIKVGQDMMAIFDDDFRREMGLK